MPAPELPCAATPAPRAPRRSGRASSAGDVASPSCAADASPAATARTTARCSATAWRQLLAFSKWRPSCSNSGLLRSSNNSVTTRSSAALPLASASPRWNSRSPRIGMTPRAMSSSIALSAARRRLISTRRVAARGDGRQFGLDQRAGADDVEGAQRGVTDAVARRVQRLDVDARAHAHLDQPLDFERDQGFAHRWPRHAELRREVALRRQPAAQRPFAGRDQRAQLIGDLAVQAAGFDDLQRHERMKIGLTT